MSVKCDSVMDMPGCYSITVIFIAVHVRAAVSGYDLITCYHHRTCLSYC